jgi:hypothetical protein
LRGEAGGCEEKEGEQQRSLNSHGE